MALGEVNNLKEKMLHIYEVLQTPYKYGMVVTGTKEKDIVDVDCQGIFRYKDKWYMTYVSFDIKKNLGYCTHLASSMDLLHWNYEGCVFAHSEKYPQCAAFPALFDINWGGSNEMLTHAGKYWWSTMEGAVPGYEGAPMHIGLLSTGNLADITAYVHHREYCLSPLDSDTRAGEHATLYKSTIIYDADRTCGYPYVMFYNARDEEPLTERIYMAVSEDMRSWKRFGDSYVLYREGYQITGDPQIIRMQDMWVMLLFNYGGGSAKAFDTFAVSEDLQNWTLWEGEPLVQPSEEYDSKHAHKPWVICHEGVVYHFYCARALDGRARGIALATSKELRG